MPKLILFADLKLREKNSSVNTRFKIFVMGFRARKFFGTFENWALGPITGIIYVRYFPVLRVKELK